MVSQRAWKDIWDGIFQHLIVSPEQLGPYNGHLPRLARLLRENHMFAQKITCVHVDKAPNIHTAGLPHYGEDAFWLAYGKLGLLHVFLSSSTPVQALSATLPNHILATVKSVLALSPDALELHLSTNHQNIMYATLPIVGNLHNFNNLCFLIPLSSDSSMAVPKTLVFHDSNYTYSKCIHFTKHISDNICNICCNGYLHYVYHIHNEVCQQYACFLNCTLFLPYGICKNVLECVGKALWKCRQSVGKI